MKPAALTFVAAALSLALPAAAFAASPNRPGESYDQKVGGVTSTTPQKQQAQTGSNQNDDSGKCQGLKQRSQELSDSEAQSKDHGDFAHTRNQRDGITDQIAKDCGQ